MDAAVILPDRMEAGALEALRQALLQHRGADLTIAAHTVTRIDGQGLQLLASAIQTWRRDGQQLHLSQASSALVRAFETVGLPLEPTSLPA